MEPWIADIFFTLVHLVIIGFNLTGWIWERTRKLHFGCILFTAASWLLLGIWYGIGYCPITDWQWQIKEQLGEKNLPGSFIKYFLDRLTGNDVSATFIDTLTALCFALAAALSVYVTFFKKHPMKSFGRPETFPE
ncbi:MAG: hypothetical protein AVDCRST_MAG56-142 [uncultured Cytophagales bacterium]|uniref:DUF2784 domain-containing protein n=1 Tax=uncultured Cytophagales bacterium TaxID=158755 RepID=A0A6J4H5I1_9SPHI|nr:MAG: hypothetical protein AVDCRST_MAG56-142 [uncultured Cytophagales bacterium]